MTRATGAPFEVIGAPYIDDVRLAAELNRASLNGVSFVPLRFTPTASTFKDKVCGGVSILVTDRYRLAAVDAGIVLGLTLQRLYPKEFALNKVQTLLQSKPTLEGIKEGKPLAEIKREWSAELEAFKDRRKQFLLYK